MRRSTARWSNALLGGLVSVPAALIVFSAVARIVGVNDGPSLLLFPGLALPTALGAVAFTLGLELARRQSMIVTRARALSQAGSAALVPRARRVTSA